MGKHIEVIARGLCVETDRVLVCVHAGCGYGYLPGGHVEFGEAAEQALAREFVEECGIEVVPAAPVLVVELAFEQRGKLRHEVSIVFPVKRADRSREVMSREPGIRFEWWPAHSLRTTDFRPSVIRDWLAKRMQEDEPTPTTMGWISTVGIPNNP